MSALEAAPCEELDRCPVSEREDFCDCPEERTPATWSSTFQTDLSRVSDERRNRAVGKTIRTARKAGIVVMHRPQGWTTVDGDERRNWWPVDVNLFVDYVAERAAR